MTSPTFNTYAPSHEPPSELIFQELQALARINLDDHFLFRIGQPQDEIENAPYGGSRHTVSTLIDHKPFVDFHLDVGGDFLIDPVERVPGTNWLEFCGIPAPIIPMISIEEQFAEKIHSYTLPRDKINTRTKDLIDAVLLLNQKACSFSSAQRLAPKRGAEFAEIYKGFALIFSHFLCVLCASLWR